MTRMDRIFGWKTSLRALCLIVGCLVFDQAEACLGPDSASGVLVDHIPEGFDAPVIVEVTIVNREPSDSTALIVMNARVERVVKGAVDSNTLKIVTYLGDCTRLIMGRGFVTGTLDHDAQLGLKLVAIQRPYATTMNSARFTKPSNELRNSRGSHQVLTQP